MKGRCPIALALGTLLLFAPFPVPAVETTIYVGKHFEVRDHDQPTKYVFNGSTRVARITGSLSTNTRIQRFRLHPGWNLLSLAVSATNLADQLQSPGVVASSHSWNAQTGGYLPVPQVASSGTILWVNATTNTTLSITGTYQDPVNRQIAAGAAYLPCTGLEAWSPALPPSVAAWSFSPESSTLDSQPTWLARLTSDLSTVNELPHVFAPGQAFYVNSPAPFELEIPDPALRIRYYHQDHLGSSSVMTDNSGVLVEETAHYPFGIARHEHRVRSVGESYKFTQKERDRESGLHYFEARYLAGAMARFLSVDPMYANSESSAGGPQALNLYAYVHNNPLKYADPMGLERADAVDRLAFGGGRLGNGTESLPDHSPDWGRVGNVVGGALEAAGGVGLCATLVGCVVGAPLIAHGSDKIATGIVGADQTLTARYLGKDFEEGMDLVSFAAGGAALAGTIQRKIAEHASKNLVLNIERVSTHKLPPYSSGPPPRAQTYPGIGGGNPAASAVAKQNARQASLHASWDELINSSPKEIWTQSTIDATRRYREFLPTSKERADHMKSIIDAADALFE